MKLAHTNCVLCRIHVPPSKSISGSWVLGVYGYAGMCSFSVRGFLYQTSVLQANVPLPARIHPGGWGYYRFSIGTDMGFMMWVNATSPGGHLSVFLKKGFSILCLLTRPAGAAIKIVRSSVLLLQGRIPNTKKTSRKLQLELPTPSCIANNADRATFCIFQEDQMYFFPLGLTFPWPRDSIRR